MTFYNPEYLFFLLLLIPIIFWYIYKMRKSDASLQISSLRCLKEQFPAKKMYIRHLPFIFKILALTFLIIALARPQSSNSWRTENTEGIDIMMAMDVSGSMLGEDFRPNRLEASKAVGIEFIQSRPNDNIGLVIFAGESFTQSPLTTDHVALINIFNSVRYGLLEDGTAIGVGLANAINRMKDSKTKSKVIILLTDGSNNRGDITPLNAAEIAGQFGIRVYVVGVGSKGQVRTPVQTPNGTIYQMVDSDFDEETLQEIAQQTGGKYFRATNNNALRSIYKEIDEMEKSIINIQEFSKKEELFVLFALFAFLFLFAEILVRDIIIKKMP